MPEKMIPIYCPLCCDQPFEDQQSLFFHLRALRNNLFCPICSDRFDTFESLISHLSRKCGGPKSLDAKRKCLLSISLNQGGYQLAECSSTDNLGEPELAGHPSKLKSATKVTQSSQMDCVLESTSIVHSSTSNSLTSTKSQLLILPEIAKKLSKSVTLSIAPLNKPTNAETFNSKPNTSTHINEISSDFKTPPKANLLSKDALSEGLAHSTVDTLVKTPTQINNKTIENHFTSTMSSKKTSVEQHLLEQSQYHPKVSENDTLCKKTVSVDSKQKRITFPSYKLSSAVTLLGPIAQSPATSTLNPDRKTQTASTLSGPPKRKRGRPRKNTYNNIVSSEVNGTVQPPKPLNVFPDITWKAKHFGTNEDKVNNSIRNQDVSVKNTNRLKSDSSRNYQLEEHMHQVNDDDKPDLFKDSNNRKHKLISNIQNKEKNCQLSITERNKKSLEKDETKAEAAGFANDHELKPEEDEEYTCSACNVRFTSIYEHIRQFHNGEEVVVEVPEEEINDKLKAFQGDKVKTSVNGVDISSTVDNNKKEISSKNIIDTEIDVKYSNILKCKDKCYSDSKQLFSLSNKSARTLNFNHIDSPYNGKWICTNSGKKIYHQFVKNPAKFETITSELTDGGVFFKNYNASFKDLFENPKINLIEVTDKLSAPFFTYKKVDFEKPIPMYVTKRQTKGNSQCMLGDTASYILGNAECKTPIPESSTLISVMNVVLASDNELSVENIVFNKRPCANMIPVLEDVTQPTIPLLINAKMLKWLCTKCLTKTWKFPLSANSHMCNTCLICHKPFVSSISLRNHTAVHKKDGSNFCFECNKAFANKGLFRTHTELHSSHALCAFCKLFVPKNKEEEHHSIHNKNPHQQFPCSVCQKVFTSNSEVKDHEIAQCSRLVAKFNCSVCDKKFFSLTALSFHMRKHKNIIIQFPCRFCNKTFIKEKEQCLRKTGKRKPSSFIEKVWHERIHTRERPYLCSACPKRFRSLPHQQSHAAQAHRCVEHRAMPVQVCRVCDKTFSSLEKLSLHMLTHNTSSSQQDITQKT